jgi:hypothetical protein
VTCVCGACSAARGELWARLDFVPGDSCASVHEAPAQPEPALFCSEAEFEDEAEVLP